MRSRMQAWRLLRPGLEQLAQAAGATGELGRTAASKCDTHRSDVFCTCAAHCRPVETLWQLICLCNVQEKTALVCRCGAPRSASAAYGPARRTTHRQTGRQRERRHPRWTPCRIGCEEEQDAAVVQWDSGSATVASWCGEDVDEQKVEERVARPRY